MPKKKRWIVGKWTIRMRKSGFRKGLIPLLILLMAFHAPPGFASGGGEGVSPPADQEPVVVKVESAADFTVALRSDGTVWAWGQNHAGQLASDDLGTEPRLYPRKVELGNVFIRDIAAGDAFVLALDIEGRIWQWGCYLTDFSSCSHEPLTSPALVTVDGSPLIAEEIDAGYSLAIARTADGEVWTWGSVRMAGWGSAFSDAPSGSISLIPSRVLSESGEVLKDVVQIAGSHDLAMALKSDGTVHLWGTNANLGLGVPGDSSLMLYAARKLDLPDNPFAVRIASHSLSFINVIETDQGVYGWARSGTSIGLGNDAYDSLPQRLPFLDGLTEIAVGTDHIYGIAANGELIRTSNVSYGTVSLPAFGKVVSIFAGYKRIFALNETGTVLTAGSVSYGMTDAGSSESILSFNLLGNGRMNFYFNYWENTDENEPLPMLAFDGLPPVPAADVYQYYKRFEVHIEVPLGEYDRVYVELYGGSGELLDTREYVRKDGNSFWEYYSSPVLETGHYRIEVYAHDTRRNKTSHRFTSHVELKQFKRTFVLYGAPADLDLNLEILEMYDGNSRKIEDVSVNRQPFYTIYEFYGYPDASYEMTVGTPGYRLLHEWHDGGGSEDLIIETQVIPAAGPYVWDDLRVEEGRLYGWLWWSAEESVDSAEYRLSITDINGNSLKDLEFLYDDENDEYYIDLSEIGIEIPEGSAYLRLFETGDDGEPVPTYFRKWLDTELQFPKVTLVDHHDRLHRLKPELSFNREIDESRILFYQVAVLANYGWNTYYKTLALIPAGQQQYVQHLPEIALAPRDELVIRLVDLYGNVSAAYERIDIVDNIKGHYGMIGYQQEYGSYYATADLPAPALQPIVDINPYPAQVSGTLSLTRPSGSESFYLYDVYYGDRNGRVIGGLVRLRHPPDAPDTVEYRLDSLPAGADRLVIVVVRVDSDYFEYDPEGLGITIEDLIVPSAIVRSELNLPFDQPVNLSHIAEFVVEQLESNAPVDVTGDSQFDRRDIRALLEALVEQGL